MRSPVILTAMILDMKTSVISSIVSAMAIPGTIKIAEDVFTSAIYQLFSGLSIDRSPGTCQFPRLIFFFESEISLHGGADVFLDRLNPCNFCNRLTSLSPRDSGSM